LSRGWLIVFAKAPRIGLVKTRMSPPLTLEQAAELYDAMLVDVLEASADFAFGLDLTPVLAFYPPNAASELIGRAPPGYRLQAQWGANLGERMANAFAESAAAGADRILLRGSDSPALGRSVVEAALNQLDAGDELVLTPDKTGGYGMIGMRRPHSALFDLEMSTPDMYDGTTQIARALGLRYSTTEACFDLDTVGDFRFFDRPQLAQLSDLCPRTVRSMSNPPLCEVL
jgi:rSAM/selenodomain-associated transferase 1